MSPCWLGGTLGWGNGLALPDQEDADHEEPKKWGEVRDNGRAPPAGVVETGWVDGPHDIAGMHTRHSTVAA